MLAMQIETKPFNIVINDGCGDILMFNLETNDDLFFILKKAGNWSKIAMLL